MSELKWERSQRLISRRQMIKTAAAAATGIAIARVSHVFGPARARAAIPDSQTAVQDERFASAEEIYSTIGAALSASIDDGALRSHRREPSTLRIALTQPEAEMTISPKADAGSSFQADWGRSAPFTIGSLKGSRLKTRFYGSGSLALSGTGVKSLERPEVTAGPLALLITPKAKLRKRIAKQGSARIRIKIRFSPVGGLPSTVRRTVVLRRR